MTSHFREPSGAARFAPERYTKSELFSGKALFLGLNCFEPGQTQRVHAHTEEDKFYFIIEGKARMTVGEETAVAEAGTLVWAPAGVPHGVVEALTRTVMLVGMAGPGRSGGGAA